MLWIKASMPLSPGTPPYHRDTTGGVTVYAERETPTAHDVLAKFLADNIEPMDPAHARGY